MKEFKGRVAVITGGGGGLGRAFADRAHALGMKLVLSDVREEPLQAAMAALRGRGADVVGLAGDVSQGAHLEDLANLAWEKFGGAHLLMNNAGVGAGGLIWENTVKDWEWVMNVNVWGVIHGVRAFVPRMLAAAKADPSFEGHVVNVSSIAGLICPQLLGAYNVSKHAVVAYSETLFHDLNATEPRIGASVLCPGFTPTGISQSHLSRPAALQNESAPSASMMKAQQMIVQAVQGGKITAEEVAALTFDAIRDGRFYILTHPRFTPLVLARLEDQGKQQNPRDIFGMKQ